MLESDSNRLKQLDIDNLLAALDNKEEEIIPNVESDAIISFISIFDIKAGTQQVPSKALYKLFKKSKPHIKMASIEFTHRLSNYFTYKNTYFYINIDVFFIGEKIKKPRRKTHISKIKARLTSVLAFMGHYNIKPGDTYIEWDILYYFFNTFCVFEGRRSMKCADFINIISQHLPSKHLKPSINGGKCFGVDECIKEKLDKDVIKRWREGRAKYKPTAHSYYEKEEKLLYKEEKKP